MPSSLNGLVEVLLVQFARKTRSGSVTTVTSQNEDEKISLQPVTFAASNTINIEEEK